MPTYIREYPGGYKREYRARPNQHPDGRMMEYRELHADGSPAGPWMLVSPDHRLTLRWSDSDIERQIFSTEKE